MSDNVKLDPQLISGLAEFSDGPYDLARKIEAYYDKKLRAQAPDGSMTATFNDLQERGIIDESQRNSLSGMCGNENSLERLQHELTLIANQAAENIRAGRPAKITEEQFDGIQTKGTEFFIRKVSPFGHLFR
jgi:DNA-binding PadR family transcriptional regulator